MAHEQPFGVDIGVICITSDACITTQSRQAVIRILMEEGRRLPTYVQLPGSTKLYYVTYTIDKSLHPR